MLLELKNAKISYGVVEAVRNVTVSVEEDGFIALIGNNGAGKSSILNAISGLVSVLEGELWLKGRRIEGLTPQERVERGIIQVPEGRRIFAKLKVVENLMMGAYLRRDEGEIRVDIDRVFSLFPVLEKKAKQKAENLSGGEQQMLAMGRALMAKPTVLLLDEPTLGLSPILCQRLGKHIKTINEEGIGIILVEQNARMALRLAKRGYVLEKGSVVMEGLCEGLRNNAYVARAFLGG